jgi:hypothetical protein
VPGNFVLFFVCSGVLWAGSGGYPPPAGTVLEGGGDSLVPNGTIHIMVISTWVRSPAGTILVPVGSLCVAFCAVVFFGLDLVVGPTPPPERSWVVEVLLHQMELFIMVWSTFSLGSGVTGTILVPVGSLCGFVCSGVLWAGSGGRTHCGTVLEGGGGPTKWNFLMVGQPFHLGLESTGTMW